MDCSLPGSPIHRIFQARVLKWGAIAFSDKTQTMQIKDHIMDKTTDPFQLKKIFV